MILEILGTRILAPYWGSTITIWSAIISVILASISMGYYVGGKLADREASQVSPRLPALLFLAGVFIINIFVIQSYFLGWGSSSWYGMRAILDALIVFSLPAFFLGIITTYTIQTETKKIGNVGSTNGILYGISTMGSLVGVFLTSFYLIPHFNVSHILISLGILFFITALVSHTNMN